MNDLLIIICREYEDLRPGKTGADLAGGFHAINARHRIVQHSYVGRGFNGLADGFFAIGSFGNDSPAGLALENPSEACARHSSAMRMRVTPAQDL
jgi:hypothetical protein